MRLLKLLVIIVFGYGISLPVTAAQPKVIGCDDLAPEPVAYDNPSEQLSPEQIAGLRKLLHFQSGEASSGNVITPKEAAELQARLEADGLD